MSGKNPLGNGKEPQSYEGTNALFPVTGFRVQKAKSDPNTNNKYPAPSLWLNTVTNVLWLCTAANGTWVQLGGSGSSPTFNAITSTGNVSLTGAGTQLQVHGGAATDFIGTSTLVAGTVTIANTNIAATDRVFLQRIAANGSTTLGEMSYTISAATSFTVTSLILGTPASTQTADTSTFSYLIVRQI